MSDLDEDPYITAWTSSGLYLMAWQRTKLRVFRMDPNSGRTTEFATTPDQIFGIDFTPDGQTLTLVGRTEQSLDEVYHSATDRFIPTKLTNMTRQIDGWELGTSEVVSWESRDGSIIEGVLHKPDDFDPSQKYPLFVVIHGGPTGIDYPTAVTGYVYPVHQWLAKGALVLRPNYRGSAGYGEAFRSLNVRNLGVGDAWDVLSGVDHLVAQGIIDTDRMGAMGWSQGGYISAYLTTTTDRFAAISVGAGISNWVTYYVNTDIHPFTRQYLKATPWEDSEIYAKTSPMTFINDAVTPTLIQHGEFDRRVPIPNAYELYQGLQDVGIETKLVVYKGFGHGISKPKERLAAVWHNWQWFGKHIWGEDIELPLDLEKEESSTEENR
jgi:dipeptidyl aminopeptidase/acylaminoacyl peptidase